MFRSPVRSLPDGGYALALDDDERGMLRRIAEELRELVEDDSPHVARLFPPAFNDDPEAAAEFDGLVREGLVSGRVAALATLVQTAEAERLDHDQLEAWCGAINDMRLVLGERLGVTEDLYERDVDPRDRRAPDLALYGWLSWLQTEIVEALSARLR
jgi:hypothetical protein